MESTIHLHTKMRLLATLMLLIGAASGFGLPSPPRALVKNIRKSPMIVPCGGRELLVGSIDTRHLPSGNALRSEAAPESTSGDPLRVSGGAGSALSSIDIPLFIYFVFWYIGNYFYNISNKLALRAAGGAAGFPMTISALQLGIGSLYGIFLWVAPDARKPPSITFNDIIKMLPVALCYAGAHSSTVFSISAGSVSFGQIVKSAEPAFAAVLSQFVYGKRVSKAKWLCLPIVIGGVILACVNELDFAMSALISACMANMFAAVRGNENKKVMETEGLKDRLGSIGNQFCITSTLGFLLSVPFMVVKEGKKFGQFVEIFKTDPVVKMNLIASALWFYGYNELSTMTIKKTSAVTMSVANTAKRVIVIIGSAMVLGESLGFMKLLGCAIGVGGVLLYSVIDQLVASRK